MSELALQLIAENKKTKNPYLDLGLCGLTDLPEELLKCTWLEVLILSYHWWDSDGGVQRRAFKNSQNSGSGNRLRSIVGIENLLRLKKLIISADKGDDWGIADISPLKNLKNLQILDVSHTQAFDLSSLEDLQNLQHLNVLDTWVEDLSPLKNLQNLQVLVISSTRISDLSPLKNLIKKGILVKWSNKTWEGNGIYIENCLLTNPPVEIVKKGNEAILNYFAQIEAQGGTEEILEAKMLIVGEGKTGKTTLFEKMKDPAFDPLACPTDETHGINIHEGLEIKHKSLGEQVFRANLWDFGGQELQYMTHQFFLTPRALYVLMMDARTEAPNLPYWFKIISLLGKDREDSPEKVPLLCWCSTSARTARANCRSIRIFCSITRSIWSLISSRWILPKTIIVLKTSLKPSRSV